MKTCGIICEYNPFHFGHKYQLSRVKENFDAAVCVMSGSFVQRGELAVFDKWTRADAALSNGADLVIELPVKSVLSSAEGFAMGGIMLLDAMGIIDSVSFGSECGDIEKLTHAANTLLFEDESTSKKIKEFLSGGMSYASARAAAYNGILDETLLSSPNNILGIEYIKALTEINSKITPITHTRRGGYHDTSLSSEFPSATAIREQIKNGKSANTPFDFSESTVFDTEKLTDIFKYCLLSRKKDAFSNIADIEPGLDNRFLKAVNRGTLTEIIDAVKTKRYARTRLSRIAMRVILNLTDISPEPAYIRVLGFNDTGRELLSSMKKKCELPIVTKVADFKSDAILPDIRATDIASLAALSPTPFGRDYTTSPVIK